MKGLSKKKIKIDGDDVELTVKNPYDMLSTLYGAITNEDKKEFLSDCISSYDGDLTVDNDILVDKVLFSSKEYQTLIFYMEIKSEMEVYDLLSKIQNLTRENTKDGSWVGLTDEQIDANRTLLKACLDSMNKPNEEY